MIRINVTSLRYYTALLLDEIIISTEDLELIGINPCFMIVNSEFKNAFNQHQCAYLMIEDVSIVATKLSLNPSYCVVFSTITKAFIYEVA